MSVDLIKNTITASGAKEEIDGEVIVNETVRLQDNMPSVQKVLFTSESVLVKGTESYMGGVAVNGEVHATVVYQGENGMLDSVNAVLPFEFLSDAPLKFGGSVYAVCEVAHLEVQPMKQRRIDLSANVKIKGFCADEIALNTLTEIAGIEGMNYKRDIQKLTFMRNKLSERELNQSIPIGSERPGKVFYSGAFLRDVSTNSSASGVLVNALVELYALYTTFDEEDNVRYHSYNDTFVVNQFTEVEFGAAFDSFSVIPTVAMAAAQFVYNDASEVELSISGTLSTQIILYNEIEFYAISDMYSTKGELKVISESKGITYVAGVYEGNTTVTETLKLKSGGLNKISGCSQNIECEIEIEEDTARIQGTIDASFLVLRNAEGDSEVLAVNKPFTIEQKIEGDPQLFAYARLEAAEIDIVDDEANIQFKISAIMVASENRQYADIFDATLTHFEDVDDNYVSIKVRYVKEGESLWNLAKENRTSIANLLIANNIEAESSLKANQPIIIRNY
ncbi:MAG: LysM peptidoglycan-binding domain-containing protein [Eubacteriaceae bacterium]|nr:LysM peptidoglycan-binding domain-containing protein [Eubacteriaceae bacterium]